MSIHLVSLAILVALAVASLALTSTWRRDRQPPPSPTITTSSHSERFVVMPTAGGQLEIATVRVSETFTRSDSKLLFDFLDLGTTVSEVRVDAVYRFHIGMAKAWPLRVVGRTCLVRAGAVRPTLPVAFDSATIERRTSSGWARFDRAENLRLLESSLTALLAERAPLYAARAREAGRALVAEFVLEWLVREQQWRRDPEHRVVVVFDDEPGPAARAASEPSYLKGTPVHRENTTQHPDKKKSLWRH